MLPSRAEARRFQLRQAALRRQLPRQAGRRERCALAEIGIRYWRYLPRVFNWAADRDHVPCPFHAGYQLARNALAACFTPDGGFDPNRGHALLIYGSAQK